MFRVVAGISGVWRIQRKRGLFDDQIVRREFQIVVGAESEIIVLILRGRINPDPLFPAERPLFGVARDDVLAKFRADGLEDISKVPDNRKITQDRMLALSQVMNDNCGDEQ